MRRRIAVRVLAILALTLALLLFASRNVDFVYTGF